MLFLFCIAITDAGTYICPVTNTNVIMQKNTTTPKAMTKATRKRVNNLFARIEETITQPDTYANPRLTRKMLADMLDTNETYIHQAITHHTALTFTGYLTRYRVEQARILLDDDEIYTNNEIMNRCGFGSRSSYYRHFRRHYGMSPEMYRNAVEEEEEDSAAQLCDTE